MISKGTGERKSSPFLPSFLAMGLSASTVASKPLGGYVHLGWGEAFLSYPQSFRVKIISVLLIYLFLAALGLHCSAGAFSS